MLTAAWKIDLLFCIVTLPPMKFQLYGSGIEALSNYIDLHTQYILTSTFCNGIHYLSTSNTHTAPSLLCTANALKACVDKVTVI
jgi:hypothetical protein